MTIAFFVSSVGDTDLAKATITKLIDQGLTDQIWVIPLTAVAASRTEDLSAKNISRIKLAEILKLDQLNDPKQITPEELAKINAFIADKHIRQAYIGVASPLDEAIPYQIAEALEIPCTVAYEYMFTPSSQHLFWRHLPRLADKPACQFAVPLPLAKEAILSRRPHAQVAVVGHLSIDQAMTDKKIDRSGINKKLAIKDSESLVFISGTTQPHHVDLKFVEALLGELATGQYPNLQIRFGIHPGVANLASYVNQLLTICATYPQLTHQFKIIIPDNIKAKLASEEFDFTNPFLLVTNVSGSEASAVADKIAQAVPGALVNEAAIKGKPSYFHVQESQSYLPNSYFAKNIADFFNADAQAAHSRHEIGVSESSVAESMSSLLLKNC